MENSQWKTNCLKCMDLNTLTLKKYFTSVKNTRCVILQFVRKYELKVAHCMNCLKWQSLGKVTAGCHVCGAGDSPVLQWGHKIESLSKIYNLEVVYKTIMEDQPTMGYRCFSAVECLPNTHKAGIQFP